MLDPYGVSAVSGVIQRNQQRRCASFVLDRFLTFLHRFLTIFLTNLYQRRPATLYLERAGTRR
jgi:hypothetical protein